MDFKGYDDIINNIIEYLKTAKKDGLNIDEIIERLERMKKNEF